MLELDEHIELAALGIAKQQRCLGGCVRGLAHRKRPRMVSERPFVHLLQEFVETRPVREALVADPKRRAGRAAIGQAR